MEAEVSDAYSSESEADERTTVEDTSTVETTTIDTAGPTLVLTSEEVWGSSWGVSIVMINHSIVCFRLFSSLTD